MTRGLPSALAQLGGELDPAAARALEAVGAIDELAAEGCLRMPVAPTEVVVGFRSEHRARLLAVAEQVAPAHHARIARWLDAHAGARDLGFKVGGRAGDLQIYVRGELEPAAIAEGFATAQVPCTPAAIRNGLRLFDQRRALMLGLELDGERVSGAVYGGVRRTRPVVGAIRDAFRFLTAALVPARVEAWRAIAPVLLDAPGEELVYFSFAPVADGTGDGWVKLDVGERPLGTARRALEAVGLADAWPAVIEQIERREIRRWSHVGVRLGARGVAVVLYWPLANAEPA